MCRVCGRMAKCIFDSMPSRIPTVAGRARQFSNVIHQPAQSRLVKTQSQSQPQLQSLLSRTLLACPPHRAMLHQAATVQQELASASPLDPSSPPPPLGEFKMQQTSTWSASSCENTSIPTSSSSTTTTPAKSSSPPNGPLIISKSLRALLPSLAAQKPHYVTAHIHRFPYLLTEGDTLRLPFHLHGVCPGDVLRFNRASILGSRDYTLKAGLGSHSEEYDGKRREPRYVDERLFECRVRVMGIESQPMRVKEKTKRRNRKVKTVRSKHRYTVCRVMEVRVKGLDELMQEEKGAVVLE